jgi:type IV pilus assembly protein PilV
MMPMPIHIPRGARRRQAGFTLLEILVSLLLIAIGVLGTAGLQALSMKINQGGQLRSQAVVLGMDFVERIEANNPATVLGKYAPATYPTSFTTDCSVNFCSTDDLATYDLVEFQTRVQALLPGSSVAVSVSGTGPFTYTVQITWVERISRAQNTTTDTGASIVTGGGATETFSYSITRMYQNRQLIV